MPETDDEFLDEMLRVLYEKENKEPVYVHEELSYLFEPDHRYTDEFEDLSAKIRAELIGNDLAENGDFGTVMRITPFGRSVYKAGGWIRYTQSLREEKQEERARQREIHQATLDSAKATVDAAKSAKNSTRASWVSAVFAVIAVLFSIYQYTESLRLQSQINELKSEPKLPLQQSQEQKANPIKSLAPADSLPSPKKIK